MDNQEPMNPDAITGGSDQNIPISPNIPTPEANLSTAPSQGSKNDFFFGEAGMNTGATPVTAEPVPSAPVIMPTDKPKSKPTSIRLVAGILTGLGLLAIIGIGIYYFVFLKNGATVTISSSLPIIDLVIDGTPYPGVTTPYAIKLGLGDHNVVAKKDGFSDMSKSLSVTSRSGTYTLAFDLQTKPIPNQLLAKEIFFPAYSKDTRSILFFDKVESGYTLKEYNIDNKTETSLVENIYDVTKTAWSPSYKQLAMKVVNSEKTKSKEIPFLKQYGEGAAVNWIVNLERKDLVNITTKELNPSIKNISFNPLGTKIAYLFQNETQRLLAVADPDGTNYERLYEFKTIEFEPDIVWSGDGSELAIFANQEGGVLSKAKNPNVFVYSFPTKAITKVSDDGVSYGGVFSPDGKYIAYNSGNTLSIYDLTNKADGYKGVNLNIEAGTSNVVWIDSSTMIIIASDKSLYRVNVNGTKEPISYNGESITGGIKSILANDSAIFIISNIGVYQLDIAKGV